MGYGEALTSREQPRPRDNYVATNNAAGPAHKIEASKKSS
jgi:hypothetical protein